MSVPALTVQVDGGPPVTGDNLNTYEQTCDTINALRGFVGIQGVQVYVRGTSTVNDGGQGPFYWNATGVAPDDGGVTTVIPTGSTTGAGEWTRLGLSGTTISSLNVTTSLKLNSSPVFDKVVVRTITSTTVYTPTTGMAFAKIECWGGGGAGGGIAGSVSGSGGGGGGGAGGYSLKWAAAATVGASQTATIGAGGTPGSAGSTAGGNGGITSLGSLCTALGGTGGGPSYGTVGAGGNGGSYGTGDVTGTGAPGCSTAGAIITTVYALGGIGGSSSVGGGGYSPQAVPPANVTGIAGSGYASGGSGGAACGIAANAAGGAGAPGLIVITEYCSA